MSESGKKIHRTGAHVIRAAEGRPAQVAPREPRPPTTPSGSDRTLARALLREKRS